MPNAIATTIHFSSATLHCNHGWVKFATVTKDNTFTSIETAQARNDLTHHKKIAMHKHNGTTERPDNLSTISTYVDICNRPT